VRFSAKASASWRDNALAVMYMVTRHPKVSATCYTGVTGARVRVRVCDDVWALHSFSSTYHGNVIYF